MGSHRVAAAHFDVANDPLQARVGERLDLPAVVADDVMVVMLELADGLEAHHAVTEVEPLDEPPLGEDVEHSVDAGQPHPLALRLQFAVEVLRADAALLALEELDHAPPSEAAAVPRRLQLCQRPV